VFTAGRIRSNVAVQTSRERQAVITYRSVILKALEDVQDSLVNYSQEQERRDRLSESVEQSQLAVNLANDLYRAGLADFLPSINAS
jgi:outer membrane protein TolC